MSGYRIWLAALLFAIAGPLTGCSRTQVVEVVERPLASPLPPKSGASTVEESPPPAGRMAVEPMPSRPSAARQSDVSPSRTTAMTGAPAGIALDQVALPVFINTVFGDILKLNYQVDPALLGRNEVVTLRTGGVRPQAELLDLTRRVLETYGIAVFERDGLYRIAPSAALQQQVPSIVRSRAIRDVPASLRPVFQFVEVKHSRPQNLANMLTEAFGQRVRISPTGTALVLFGQPEDVRMIMGAMEVLDQPTMQNRVGSRLTPVFWSPEGLSNVLIEVLRGEGYEVSNRADAAAPIQMIPVTTANALFIFAPDRASLDHVIAWASDVDRPSPLLGPTSVFYYPVRNTKAETIAPLLGIATTSDVGGLSSPTPAAPAAPAASGGAAATSVPPPASAPSSSSRSASSGGGGGKIVVDTARNAIIFRGSAEEYSQIRSLLEHLDKSTREVMIEVTVAEVSLDDQSALGVEWLLNNSGLGQNFEIGTLGGLGIGSSGLNFTILNSANDVRAVLNAFAKTERINVLSNPRLVAKSGSEARIQVGNEVPIVTSQQTSQATIGGNTGVLQQITYRSTGVILNIKPVVHAGNRVDIDLTQEVSDAAVTQTSQLNSPTIQNRRITTSLSLRDGSTVLLGGLMQENRSSADTGVPFMRDLPVVGQLFRTDAARTRKTELLLLITPFIIDTDEDAQSITDAFRSRFPPFATTSPSSIGRPFTP